MTSETGQWMPLYWGDYFGDTTHLTTEQHGAYLLLIGTYWRRGGPLPDDDKWLASVTKMHTNRWRVMRKTMTPFFDIIPGVGWRHKRIENEILKSSNRLQSARAAGKAGGLAKSKLTTTTSTYTKKDKKEGCADAQPEYAFEGKIVRLKNADFEKWKDAYAGGNSDLLRSLLQARDDWLCSPDAETGRRAKWFITTSNWLASKVDERNGHGSEQANIGGSTDGAGDVMDRLRARREQGLAYGAGGNADPVLPAVSRQ